MTVIVRGFRPEDAEGFARVRRAALPFMLSTAESVAFDVAHAHPDAHYRPLVAEEDGEIIGTAQLGVAYDSPEHGQGYANVYVHPERLRRGAGSLVVRTAEEYLAGHGVTTLYSWVLDAPGNRAFAEKHGYRASRSAHFLRLDLAGGTLPPLQRPPAGVELRTATDFADDPRPLFDLDAETVQDEPGDIEAEFTDYEHWLAETWGHPLLDRELTTVAVVDGRPVAFTAARTDGVSRYATGMTGTARAYRGRGLAKLAKNDSLHRARAAGYSEAFTGNDAENGPMLAINKWFGYEICATEVRYVRELG
ncbi:GNAT family N-acetyltransferase [Streptomyces sp. PSKA54]|uniref:GNAT family N-acetyltransferase n=1 Tax=Streptomyces himalayensis subsp. aureolus TaxID=2758039 RepID=A0A7W2D5E0_9ACTN|nr:GNAT family N-acetyltransferase [Streptomyces himalayensis]MBA4865098.1 GNAT family N-acetyltransferase [Streptomyces himalayensis subsp. aureolus]